MAGTDLFGAPLIEGRQRCAHLDAFLLTKLREMAEENRRAGGFQAHVRETLARIDEHGRLSFDDAYIGHTWRLASLYGRGGWQDVCNRILSCIASGDRESES